MPLFGDDLRHAERRMPIHSSDAHRVGDHDPPLSGLGLWVVVQTMLRQINYDSFVRRWRQDTAHRKQDFLSTARRKDISAGIGAHDLRIPQTVPARDFEQLLLIAEFDAAIASRPQPNHPPVARKQRQKHSLTRLRSTAPTRFVILSSRTIPQRRSRPHPSRLFANQKDP